MSVPTKAAMPKSAIFTRPSRVEQQIFRLDVAVDHALFMGVLQGLTYRRHDRQRLLRVHFSVLQQVAQIYPVDIFHDEVVKPVGFTKIVNGHDVGVAHLCQKLGLALETPGKVDVSLPLTGQHLDGHHPVERLLTRLVDDPHTATTQALQNLELWKSFLHLLRRERSFHIRPFALRHRLRFKTQSHQTPGTKPARGIVPQLVPHFAHFLLLLIPFYSGNRVRCYTKAFINARISSSTSDSSATVRATSSRMIAR